MARVQPLVENLKAAESYNAGIAEEAEARETARRLIEGGEPLANFDAFLEVYGPVESEPIDTDAVQRRLIYGRLGGREYPNPIIIGAIDRGRTVEESLNELASVNQGLERFLPRKRDGIHNQRVNYMAQLLGQEYSLRHLQKNGIFRPDNFITGGLYGAAIMPVGIGAGALVAMGLTATSPEEVIELVTKTSDAIGFVSAMMGTMCGLFTQTGGRGYSGDGRLESARENARYIDATIARVC